MLITARGGCHMGETGRRTVGRVTLAGGGQVQQMLITARGGCHMGKTGRRTDGRVTLAGGGQVQQMLITARGRLHMGKTGRRDRRPRHPRPAAARFNRC